MNFVTPTMDLRKSDPDGIFIGDNGMVLCGEHLGMTARLTGHDLSGQKLHKLTKREATRELTEFKWHICCESCGKSLTGGTNSTLYEHPTMEETS